MKYLFFFCSIHVFASTTSDLLYDRVINISATFLDVVPVSLPPLENGSIEAGSLISFLPKLPDPALGDAPRFHGIPVLNVSKKLGEIKGFIFTPNVWAGTLIPGFHELLKVEEDPYQYVFGTSITISNRTNNLVFFSEMGAQYAYARVENIKKPIKSSIKTTTKLFFASFGVLNLKWGVWSDFLVSLKSTHIRIYTPENEYLVDRKDTLDDSKVPLIYQLSVGTDFNKKIPFRLVFSEVWVSKRIFMPRVYFAYYKEGFF